MDWRKLLSMGSQKVPKVIDDVVPVVDDAAEVAERGLVKKGALEADEILGGPANPKSPVDDILDAELVQKVTPEVKQRMDPRLAALLGAGALGGVTLMSGDEESVEIPMAKKAEQPKDVAPPTEQMAEAPKKISPAQRAVSVADVQKADEAVAQKKSDVDFMKIAANAQLKAEQERDRADLGEAMERIASGFLYGKPDLSSSDRRRKDASRFIEYGKNEAEAAKQQQSFDRIKAETDDEDKLRDPNSDASKMTRQVLARYGLNVKSAKEAKDAGINVQNILLQEMAAKKAKELAEMQVNKASAKRGIDFVKGAQKALLKPYQEFQKVDSAYRSLENFANDTKMEAGPKDVAMLYDFIKTLDPNSVVREGEIQLSHQGMSQLEALGLRLNKISQSDLLTPAFRQGIAQIAKSKRDQAFENYNQIRQPYMQEAQAIGLDESDFNRFDYGSQAEKPAEQPAKASNSVKLATPKKPGSVITTKSGKTYRVNDDGQTATEM